MDKFYEYLEAKNSKDSLQKAVIIGSEEWKRELEEYAKNEKK